MFFIILLTLLIVVPFAELTLLFLINDQIGIAPTLALVVLTAIAGSTLARSQGFRTYRRINEELAAGRMPQSSLVDALMILVAGALLFTPGILTDIFGLSLLLPPCRAVYRHWLARWFKDKFQLATFSQTARPDEHDPNVVDSYVVEPDSRSDVDETVGRPTIEE